MGRKMVEVEEVESSSLPCRGSILAAELNPHGGVKENRIPVFPVRVGGSTTKL